jgi:hypothetical protein
MNDNRRCAPVGAALARDTPDMNIEKLTPVQYQIVKELSRAFDRLGAARGLFAALNSWGDTVPEADVLSMLREMNGAIEDGLL